MPCPFFSPDLARLEPTPFTTWLRPPRFPLGEAYTGICRASSPASAPPVEHQEQICNFGYARGRCDHFPQDGAVDAVRFTALRDEATLPSDLLRVIYVFEKDHSPVQHGEVSTALPAGQAASDVLAAQASAFAASYRKQQALPPDTDSLAVPARLKKQVRK